MYWSSGDMSTHMTFPSWPASVFSGVQRGCAQIYTNKTKRLLHTALIWSAKNFALQACWRIFVLLETQAFKHSNYVFITIKIFI